MPPRKARKSRPRPRKTTTKSRTLPDGLQANDHVDLLNFEGQKVATGIIFAYPDGTLQSKLHGHDLSALEAEAGERQNTRYVVVRIKAVEEAHQHEDYPYLMKGTEVPKKIKDMFRLNNYVWDAFRLQRRDETQQQSPPSGSIRSTFTSASRNPRTISKPTASSTSKTNLEKSINIPSSTTTPSIPHTALQRKALGLTRSMPSGAEKQTRAVVTKAAPVTAATPISNSATVSAQKPAHTNTKKASASSNATVAPRKANSVSIPSTNQDTRPSGENDGEVVEVIDVTSEEVFTDDEQVDLPSTVIDEQLMEESSDEETEGAGDVINVPDTQGQGTYIKECIEVRVDQLVYPKNLTRLLDLEHVGTLKTSLRKGVKYTLGYISVCQKPSTRPFTGTTFPDSKFKDVTTPEATAMREFNGKQASSLKAYFVINGMHRAHAFMRLFREAESLNDRKTFGIVQVMLWSRADGKEMSFYEILALGGVENDIGRISKSPTFADQMYLCVSCVKEILDMYPNINMTGIGLGNKFHEHGVIRARSIETIRKYARVALMFAERPEIHGKFVEIWNRDSFGKKFSITHLHNRLFNRHFTSEEQLLLLDCIYDFIVGKKGSSMTPTAAGQFFLEARVNLDLINEVSDKLRISVRELMEKDIKMTKTKTLSVQDCFRRKLSLFDPSGSQQKLMKRRESREGKFRSIIVENFFPEEVEERNKQRRNEATPARIVSKRSAKDRAIQRTKTMQGAIASVKNASKRKRKESITSNKRSKRNAGNDVEVVETNEDVTPFDDIVPTRYPNKYGTRPQKWTGAKDWVGLLTVPPHRLWNDSLCVKHPTPWLHGMGVPHKHRAHIFLSAADLRRNHHAVFYHAALQGALCPAIADNPLYALREGENELSRAQRLAIEHPELSDSYLASCREEVIHRGYTIVEGVFKDGSIPEGPSKTVYDDNPASVVASFYASKFSSAEELKDKSKDNKYWNAIFNTNPDSAEEVHATGQGRFMSKKDGLYEHTERSDDTVEVARCRAALDVRALQLVVAMGLEEVDNQMIAIPCTGCRLLTNTGQCDRQVPHADFETLAANSNAFHPSLTVPLSVIWTAEDPFPLVLWEYSHVLQCGPKNVSKNVAKNVLATKVIIPPFSCIIFRGDLLHSGPGWMDFTERERKDMKYPLCFRFHLYLARWGKNIVSRHLRTTEPATIPDTITISSKFDPEVQSSAPWITES